MTLLDHSHRRRLSNLFGRKVWFQKIADRLGWIPSPKRWIFILGCYNSGTTLLQRVLATHPELATLPREGVFLTDKFKAPEAFGWPRMWARCKDRVKLSPKAGNSRTACSVKRQWSIWFNAMQPNLLEKSVTNLLRARFLQKHFSPAYFIYIRRNGLAVAEGIRRRARLGYWGNETFDSNYPIKLCANQWLETENKYEEIKNSLDRVYELSYEEFTETPERVLGEVLDFLGLEKTVTDPIDKKWSIMERNRTIENLNQESLNRLSDRERDEALAVFESKLKKFTYI